MGDLQLIGFLVLLALGHLDALLVPLGLAAAAVAAAAQLNFEPVAV